MPSSVKQGSLLFASFRRSMLTVKSDQIHSVEPSHDWNTQDSELDLFQQNISNRFNELSGVDSDEFLSISWIQKLLDAFAACQEEFKFIMCKNRAILSQQPAHKFLSEFLDRSIKALDIFNASRDGIKKIRQWQKKLDIVISALDGQNRVLGEAQFLRARKALTDLPLLMLNEKETRSMFSHRNRSFGRAGKHKDHQRQQSGGTATRHSRSQSWSVNNSWSASKQIQTTVSSLVPPRDNEVAATNGLALTIFSMSFILIFVSWTLVAALPCQDRGHPFHFSIPRQFSWSSTFHLLYSRIVDDLKKQENKDSCGLLKEIGQMEKCIHHMTDLVDAAQFPLGEEQKEDVKLGVYDLSLVREVLKTGLDPLDRHLRGVFRGVISCRTEGLQLSGTVNQ